MNLSSRDLTTGDIRVDRDAMTASVDGCVLDLTLQQYEVLVQLMLEDGRPVSQIRLAHSLWGKLPPQYSHHLSVLIARLRSKLSDSREIRLITVHKRGYALVPLLNRIELIKRAKDGLDVLDDIYRYALTGDPIDPDDLERMKWYGVFHRKQTPGYFMLRLRLSNGILSSRQMACIGDLSNRFGRGQVDITTRQNIQLRWLRIGDIPDVFRALDEVGIEYRQSGMDNLRNITGCPMAGIDPDELLDASLVVRAIQASVLGQRDFSNLPRKFNLSVSGCRHDCTTAQIHDLSLVPAIKDGRVGFNVLVGGAIGGKNPRQTWELDVFLDPSDAPEFCTALLSLFRDEGDRENRQGSRLKYLIEDWGIERFRSEMEKRVGPLAKSGEEQIVLPAGDHIGILDQKQPGLTAVGCAVPVGRLTGDDLVEFARLADVYGSGELRLTNNQNILIINVPSARLDALLEEALLSTFSPEPSAWQRRTVSCTGKDFCHFSLFDTKSRAVEFATQMESIMPLNSPLRVHWSGCQHGCGQHQIADIGFMATHLRSGNDVVEAVDVYLGGQLGPNASLATKALEAVPVEELAARLTLVLQNSRYPAFREIVSSKAEAVPGF